MPLISRILGSRVDGRVSRLWAKKHHSEWYKEISGEEKPAADEGHQEEN